MALRSSQQSLPLFNWSEVPLSQGVEVSKQGNWPLIGSSSSMSVVVWINLIPIFFPNFQDCSAEHHFYQFSAYFNKSSIHVRYGLLLQDPYSFWILVLCFSGGLGRLGIVLFTDVPRNPASNYRWYLGPTDFLRNPTANNRLYLGPTRLCPTFNSGRLFFSLHGILVSHQQCGTPWAVNLQKFLKTLEGHHSLVFSGKVDFPPPHYSWFSWMSLEGIC